MNAFFAAVIVAVLVAATAPGASAADPTCDPMSWVGHRASERIAGRSYSFEDITSVRRALLRVVRPETLDVVFRMRPEGQVREKDGVFSFLRCSASGCPSGSVAVSVIPASGRAWVIIGRNQAGRRSESMYHPPGLPAAP